MEGWIASWYAKSTARDIGDLRKDAQLVAAHTQTGAHVLEVAPGPGYLAIELAKLGRRVTGLDISNTFIQIAKANARLAGVSIDFRQGNASEMPFRNELFDFVVCRAAFKNFSEPVQALNEMYRVLNEAGTAVIIDLRKDFSDETLNDYMARRGSGKMENLMMKLTFKYMLRPRAYTKDQIKIMCDKTKFIRCEIYEGDIGLQIWLRK